MDRTETTKLHVEELIAELLEDLGVDPDLEGGWLYELAASLISRGWVKGEF